MWREMLGVKHHDIATLHVFQRVDDGALFFTDVQLLFLCGKDLRVQYSRGRPAGATH